MLNTSQDNNTSISRIIQGRNSRIDFNVALTQFVRMDGESFERAVVAVLAGIIEKKGWRHDPVANAAWPYKKAAGRAWQAVRTSGKAQKLTLRDAFCLAHYLGVPMSQLCAIVESHELQGDSFQNSSSKPQSGRSPQRQNKPDGETLPSCRAHLPADIEKV